MSLIYEQRLSDSPYIEAVTRGRTIGDGTSIRPAENSWHMVFVSTNGQVNPIYVGPLTASGVVQFTEGVEMLWIKFRLGACMPHLPVKDFRDTEITLPTARDDAFWLKSSAWQFPDYENVETFINRLAREEILIFDPVVNAALQDCPQSVSPRTLRHRFLHSTGLSQAHIRQFERAQHAVSLLERGMPILDVVCELGYFDQPHLTRSLKRFIGTTPAQHRVTTCEPE